MTATIKYITLNDAEGSAPIQVPAIVQSTGLVRIDGIISSGLTSSTAGVTDSLNKRFVTDAELATALALAGHDGPILAIITAGATLIQLAHVTGLDMNTAPAQALFTVPGATHYVVTHIIMKDASVSLTTAKISIGYTGAGYTDMVNSWTCSPLANTSAYAVLTPVAGSHVGAAGEVLKLIDTVLQGGAATATCDVYGYIF